MLGAAARAVFSKRALWRSHIGPQNTRRDDGVPRGRRKRRAVDSRRHAIGSREARGERTDAAQTDRKTDLRDRTVRVAKQRRGALKTPSEQVPVWRLTERTAELAAEVSRREACGASHASDAQPAPHSACRQDPWLARVTGRRDKGHDATSIARRHRVLPTTAVGRSPGVGLPRWRLGLRRVAATSAKRVCWPFISMKTTTIRTPSKNTRPAQTRSLASREPPPVRLAWQGASFLSPLNRSCSGRRRLSTVLTDQLRGVGRKASA